MSTSFIVINKKIITTNKLNDDNNNSSSNATLVIDVVRDFINKLLFDYKNISFETRNNHFSSNNNDNSNNNNNNDINKIQFDLKEGDILYLPTGWFHQVNSIYDDNNNNQKCDNNIGRKHIALNYWWRSLDWQKAIEYEEKERIRVFDKLIELTGFN